MCLRARQSLCVCAYLVVLFFVRVLYLPLSVSVFVSLYVCARSTTTRKRLLDYVWPSLVSRYLCGLLPMRNAFLSELRRP